MCINILIDCKQLNKQALTQIDFLRLILMMMVVVIHAYPNQINPDELNGLQGAMLPIHYFSNILARPAVPCFFVISGFLFFRGKGNEMPNFFESVSKRLKTLLVPYAIWNTSLFLVYYALVLIPSLSFILSAQKIEMLQSIGLYETVNLIFGFTDSPIAYQFWFIRDLMIMVLLSPFVYFGVKVFNIFFILTAITIWILGFWPWKIPSADAICFFSIGCYLAKINNNLYVAGDRRSIYLSAALFFSLSVLDFYDNMNGGKVFHYIGILAGVYFLILLSRFAINVDFIKTTTDKLASATFIIFSLHEPLLSITRKLLQKIFANTHDIRYLIVYLTSIVLTIFFCIVVSGLLKKMSPKLYALVTGGR